MRKTFKMFCAAAIALLAVSSCGKIWDEFDAVHGELDDLKAKVEALEKKLNDEVATLNTKIGALETAYKAADAELLKKLQDGDAELAASITTLTANLDALDGKVDGLVTSSAADLKAAIDELKAADKLLADKDTEILAALVGVGVTNVSKDEDGNAVITFTDGTTLVVGAYDANANNAGVVTVVEGEDGVKYWAVVLEDGTVKSLEVPVGHLALKFDVDAETGALMYSVDGGENWTATGAYVADSEYSLLTDFYQGSEFDYDLWEEVVDDFYTLVFGGETYYLPIYKVDNSVVTIKAGKTYFSYEEAKTFDIALADVKDVYVMTKPDGWRVKLDGKTLNVTAPSESNITSGVAEADGEVLLHCSTVEGKCKIAKLAVATTPGFSLTVSEDGSVVIVNPDVVVSVNPMMGWETVDFNDAYIGLAPVQVFEADPMGYVANCRNNYEDIIFMLSGWKQNTMDWDTGEYTIGGAYVPGEYEVDVINTSVAEIYKYITYDEVPDGSRFVVWACPVDEKGMPKTDALVFGYYSSPVKAVITAVEGGVSVSDIEVKVEVAGAESYYVGILPEEYMYGFPVDDYMQNQEGPFGYFQMAIQYGMPDYAFMYMGTLFGGENGIEMPATIKASELMGSPLMPNMKVYMWVFPVIDGMDLADYTYEENLQPYIYSFTTEELTAGSSATVEFSNAVEAYTSITVDVTATEGSTMIYYNWYDSDTFNALENVAEDLIAEGNVLAGDFGTARHNQGVTPGSSFILAAMAVDADGKYGEVVDKTFTAPEITYSETFKASVGTPVFEANGANWKVTMPVTVEGGTASKYYYYWNANARTEEQLQNLPLGYEGYYYYNEVKTIPALWFYSSDTQKQFAVVVESETGELSKPVIVTVEKPAAEETPAE